MDELFEMIDGWPNICGQEEVVARVARAGGAVFVRPANGAGAGAAPAPDAEKIRAGWGIALHMQQPLIPAGGDDLKTAEIISNLKYMMDHQGTGDNHNAPVFHWCYKRIGEFVPELVDQGLAPRVMLDYSGCLFFGLRKMGLDDVFDNLRRVTCEPRYRDCVEWLGCTWGHAVAPSTPPVDFARQVAAWQSHFAGIFGLEALARVRGFSPAEMALPNDPDVAYAFVKTLRDAGYRWVMVQEHTVEEPESGHGPVQPHLPHRLVCRDTTGRVAEILCLVKTQGSDTKLVAQMQPCYEARSLARARLGGVSVPPFVVQIGDGENGGVMMNEFPGMFKQTMREASGSDVPPLNGTEYLEMLEGLGLKDEDYPALQPKWQHLFFKHFEPGPKPDPKAVADAREKAKSEDGRFNMEGGSWTNDISWVRGYDEVLGPMERVSALFAEKTRGVTTSDERYRKALFHLLCSQTSCYRYWGQGIWVEYGKEICRRAEAILTHDF